MRQGVENNNERQHNIPTGHQSRVTPGDIGLTHFSPPLRFRNQLPTFAVRETQSLGQQMLNALLGINGLRCLSI